ncbi:MAG: hypothetical protein L6416_11485 [Candidatus Omnitrophica bacterium]|nr:hypothetical protein [Candidatus Omnitrophota bacterium]
MISSSGFLLYYTQAPCTGLILGFFPASLYSQPAGSEATGSASSLLQQAHMLKTVGDGAVYLHISEKISSW